MERPRSLSPIEAHGVIQRLLEARDCISFSEHARQRMRERSFNVDDVHRVLTNGVVSGVPIWDETFQNWKYQVSGRDCDNVPLVLVVAIEPALGRITIITGIDD
jgi:hypothetical protein